MLATEVSGDHSVSLRASHPATASSYELLLSSMTAESIYGLVAPGWHWSVRLVVLEDDCGGEYLKGHYS